MKKNLHKPRPAKTYRNERTARSEGTLAEAIIHAGGCKLSGLMAFNPAATKVYLHIWDATEVPADTTVPHFPPIHLPADTTMAVSLDVVVSTGLCISVSSTDDTTTLSSDEIFLAVNYLT